MCMLLAPSPHTGTYICIYQFEPIITGLAVASAGGHKATQILGHKCCNNKKANCLQLLPVPTAVHVYVRGSRTLTESEKPLTTTTISDQH